MGGCTYIRGGRRDFAGFCTKKNFFKENLFFTVLVFSMCQPIIHPSNFAFLFFLVTLNANFCELLTPVIVVVVAV